MLNFSIYGVEVIGDDVRSLPIVTTEDKDKAIEAFKAQIQAAFDTLNTETMRHIGGKTEVYLGACDNTFGLGADIIKQATIKRPLWSPQAEIWLSQDGRPPMIRIETGEL